MMNPYIYLRGLKRAEHTVFCVQDGQKFYYDQTFGKAIRVPYSSGQQVKRSIMQAFTTGLNINDAPTTFVFEINKDKKLGEGEVLSVCDPSYPDQLIGGWMKAAKGSTERTTERTIKRRSPLSISAMKPLHPLLGGYAKENITFDRTDRPELHKVMVRDAEGKIISDEELDIFLQGTDRSVRRKWIPDNSRANGLFVYDIAIDLRTLFCVSTNRHEPEISETTLKKLKEAGWAESKNVFGSCLVCPKEEREKLIPALAHALVNWRITSNQARTFSLMETLAVAISDNANKIAGTIRAKLIEETDEPKAKPIIDEKVKDVSLFITLPCAGYVVTANESADALEDAEKELIKRMQAFDYENQLAESHA